MEALLSRVNYDKQFIQRSMCSFCYAGSMKALIPWNWIIPGTLACSPESVATLTPFSNGKMVIPNIDSLS